MKSLALSAACKRKVAMNKPIAARPLMAGYLVAADIVTLAANSQTNHHDVRQSAQNFRLELLTMIPQLRAFARMLSSDKNSAEELSQETLAEAWRSRLAFWPETTLKVRLFMIARNKFYSNRHKAYPEQAMAESNPSRGIDNTWSAELSAAMGALRVLPDLFREALILVSASGCSYQEAARICNCPIGTIKSRVWRARRELLAIFDAAAVS